MLRFRCVMYDETGTQIAMHSDLDLFSGYFFIMSHEMNEENRWPELMRRKYLMSFEYQLINQ